MAPAVPPTGPSRPVVEPARYREVLGHFASGVTVVTGTAGGDRVGFTVQAFTALSLDPPLVAVCPGRSSVSWPRIRDAGAFCVNILGQHQETISRTFASRSDQKFEGLGWRPSSTGSPLLDDVLAWVDCVLEAEHDGGDHVVAIGRVVDLGVGEAQEPLLFYRGGYASVRA